nr:urease accessory protein UreD [Propylenella binzhouense]
MGPLHPWPNTAGGAVAWLQSVSGGLYSGERIAISLAATGREVVVKVAATAAAVVRACAVPARQDIRLHVTGGAVLMWHPRLHILLPGGALTQCIEAAVDADSTLIFHEGFCAHRPAGSGDASTASFDVFRSEIRLRRTDTGPLFHEAGYLHGRDFDAAPPGVIGRYRAFGAIHVVSARLSRAEPLRRALVERLHRPGAVYGGVAPFSREAGFVLRLAGREPEELETESDRLLGLLADAARQGAREG